MTTYDDLLSHLWHHDVRGWILAGAKAEDARTIHAAAKRASSTKLREAVALGLSEDK